MPATTRLDLVSRDALMKLLSDDEVARVSSAETKSRLEQGSEYIDLEHVGIGVQCATAHAPVVMGEVIPRAAVSDQTWTRIKDLLES